MVPAGLAAVALAGLAVVVPAGLAVVVPAGLAVVVPAGLAVVAPAGLAVVALLDLAAAVPPVVLALVLAPVPVLDLAAVLPPAFVLVLQLDLEAVLAVALLLTLPLALALVLAPLPLLVLLEALFGFFGSNMTRRSCAEPVSAPSTRPIPRPMAAMQAKASSSLAIFMLTSRYARPFDMAKRSFLLVFSLHRKNSESSWFSGFLTKALNRMSISVEEALP